MALKKLTLKPGVNRENTRYTNENGWYESDKVRFRQGTPEKIGGWQRISANTFVGICRSLWNWVTLSYKNLMGVGTNTSFFIEENGVYNNITPIEHSTQRSEGTIVTYIGNSSVVTVFDPTYIATIGQVASFNNSSFTVISVSGFTWTTDSGFIYPSPYDFVQPQVPIIYFLAPGSTIATAGTGWGRYTWGSGTWGSNVSSVIGPRIWGQNNFGEDLIYGPRGGALYYWKASLGYETIPVLITQGIPVYINSPFMSFPDLTPIYFSSYFESITDDVKVGTVYYTRYLTANSFNISTTPTGALVNGTYNFEAGASILAVGVPLSSLTGANAVPLSQNYFLVSDASRFVICFGTNDYLSTVFNPMLIRWSDQENAVEWAPAATNQAGSVLLSHGSKIVTALQSRQEILVWTDSTLYSLQYLGAPIVWGTQLQGDNISIAGPNAAALASGVVYWMGVDKFYKYDGRVSTLRCDLRQYIYSNINLTQADQIFASTNEGFNEVWFFYCSANSTAVDSYVVYNYAEDNGNGVWYYGSMARTAWIDTGLRNYPIAATYANNLVNHESGVDDGTLADPVGISAFITSAQFDLDDGNNMAFSWRMLPDLTFRGSTDGTTPSLTMQLLPLKNSGSGYNDPKSVGGVSTDAQATVTATQTYPIDLDTYNGQVNIRIRARQMAMKIASTQLGTQWQLGSPRIDLRTDGRR